MPVNENHEQSPRQKSSPVHLYHSSKQVKSNDTHGKSTPSNDRVGGRQNADQHKLRSNLDKIEEEEAYITHRQALLLMEKYNVNDYSSMAFVVLLITVVTLGLIMYMIRHASYNTEDPLFVKPHKKWSDIEQSTVADFDDIVIDP